MLEKVKRLEDNLGELRRFQTTYSLQEVEKNKHLEWALRYGLLEAIQIVIDVSCYLVSKDNLGNPTTYADCVAFLRQYGYIDDEVASKLTAMVGLRNLLVHEYIRIDVPKLYTLLDRIDDFVAFIGQVGKYLSDTE